MKVSVIALAVLIAAFCYQTSAAPIDSDPPTSCCFTYVQRALPRSFVTDYYETNMFSSRTGGSPFGMRIPLHFGPGREICANPEHDWVKKYVIELELN
uniref:Chemokine interleukin-8-like domain-containing protein n=1 Tax=Anas platyrhynchos TaxID=8839 RepID=A0A8B9TPZ4_ANAPL